ncbi:hypothetical protein ACFFRR_011792 [Megaselia abdita]
MFFALAILFLSASFAPVTSLSCLNNEKVGTWIKGEKGFFPSGSVYAGFQDMKRVDLFICRIDEIVGKYYEPEKSCYISGKDGKEKVSQQYEILTDVGHVVWVPVNNKQMPCNMIEGSINANYAGRAWISKNSLIPGNVIEGVIFIAWGNDAKSETFEALTAVPRSLILNYGRVSNIYGTVVNYFVFKVRSTDEVYIDFGVHTDMKYRLTIGAFKNRISAFGPKSNPLQIYEKTENILSSNDLRGFWVRWTLGNTLEFGAEGNLEPLVVYTGNDIHNLNSVLMSSAYQTSDWQIADLTKFNGKTFVKRHHKKHSKHTKQHHLKMSEIYY